MSAVFRALIVGGTAIWACTACGEYEPSSEPGIELAKVTRKNGDASRADVVLTYGTGSERVMQGFFLHRDGSIWLYGKAESERCRPSAATRDVRGCLHALSRLGARLTAETRQMLLTETAILNDDERVTKGRGGADGGTGILELQRSDLSDTDPLQLGVCRAGFYSQLTSASAQRIIEIFRSIRRALPMVPPPTSCPFDADVTDVRVGVLAWWRMKR